MNRRDDEREREREIIIFDAIKLSRPYFTFIFIRRKILKANGIEYGICLTFSDEKNVELFYTNTLNMRKRAALFLHLRDAT